MNNFFSAISELLTSASGSLLYSLVVGFSIAAALGLIFRHWLDNDNEYTRRRLIGLGLMAVARFLLMIFALLALSGMVDPHISLPPIERTIQVFSLGIVIWLWAFPTSSRSADLGALIGGATILLLGIITIAIWRGQLEQAGTLGFNASWLNLLWTILTLLVAAAGILVLFLRKREEWGAGVAFLSLILFGAIFHLLGGDSSSDAAGLLRLAEIASYPLLLLLAPQTLGGTTPVTQHITSSPSLNMQVPKRKKYSIDPDSLDALLTLFDDNDTSNQCADVTRTVARAMLADICFLLTASDNRQEFTMHCGFDLIREKTMSGGLLYAAELPTIMNAYEKGLPLRLAATTSTADILSLRETLNVDQVGHLLLVPLLQSDGTNLGMIGISSAYSNRKWSSEEEAYLQKFSGVLVKAFASPTAPAATVDTSHLETDLEEARLEVQQVMQERSQLFTEVTELRAALDEQPNLADQMEPLLAAQSKAQEEIQKLENEIVDLRRQLNVSDSNAIEKTAALERKNKQLVGKLEEALRDATQAEVFRERASALETENQRLLQEIDQARTQAKNEPSNQAKNTIEKLQAEVNQLNKQIDLLTGEVENERQRTAGATKILNLAQTTPLESYEEDVDMIKKKLSILIEENDKQQDFIEYLQRELEKQRKTEKENASNANELNAYREKINELEGVNHQLIAKIEDLQSSLQAAEATSTNNGGDPVLSTEKAQEYEDQINRLRSANDKLTVQLGNAQKDLMAFRDPRTEKDLQLALNEVNRLQTVVTEAEEQITKLKKSKSPTEAPKSAKEWEMISAIAQELRQPMSSIIGYSDFLLSESVGGLGSLQRKFLDRVKTSTLRMNSMLENLLQIAGMQAGQFSLSMGQVNVGQAIDQAVSQLSPQIREKNIVLSVDIPETLPPMQGDNDAIKQVALHLLQNACDVTPENGQVKLKANMESYGEDEDYVLVNVVDSGPGIQSDDIPRVFTQTMQANEQSIQGTGHAPVGLAISKTLVEAHGGRIWVESKAGNGATFSVLLPLIQSTTPAGGHWS